MIWVVYSPRAYARGITLVRVKTDHKSEYNESLPTLYKRYNDVVITQNELVAQWSDFIDGFIKSGIIDAHNKKVGRTMTKTENELELSKLLLQSFLEKDEIMPKRLDSLYEM
jgi:hypothetical protein